MAKCSRCGNEIEQLIICCYCNLNQGQTGFAINAPHPFNYPQHHQQPIYYPPQLSHYPPQPVYYQQQGYYPPQQVYNQQQPLFIPPPFYTCEECGMSEKNENYHSHICIPDMPDPRRLMPIEINTLKSEHNLFIIYHGRKQHVPTKKIVNDCQNYITTLTNEEAIRDEIISTAQKNRNQFSKFPLPSDLDLTGCRFLSYIYEQKRGYKPKSLVLAVASFEGKLYYSLSGTKSDTKSKKLLPNLTKHAGEIFAQSFTANDDFVEDQEIEKSYTYNSSKMKIRVCAEPKLWNDGQDTKAYTGMTVVWLGSAVNEFPLIPAKTGFGTAMYPCYTCCKWAHEHIRK